MDDKFKTFVTGALVGIGIGLLLAPIDGDETRKKLKESLGELLNSIKEIDLEETKENFITYLANIKDDLNDLNDKSKQKEIKLKIKHIKDTCEKLALEAQKCEVQKVCDTALLVSQKANKILEEMESSKTPKKKTPKLPKNKSQKKVKKGKRA